MKGLVRSLALLAILAFAAPAAGQSMGIGGGIELHPIGELHADDGMNSVTVDTETAFAVAGRAEAALSPNFSIAFAPRIIFNIKGEDGTSSAKQIDLSARLVGGVPVAAGKARVYGYAAPGYSFLLVPDLPDEVSNPAGFVLGFGGGAGFPVAPGLEVTAELGYQLGFHDTSVGGQSVELSTNLLHLGVGLLAAM